MISEGGSEAICSPGCLLLGARVLLSYTAWSGWTGLGHKAMVRISHEEMSFFRVCVDTVSSGDSFLVDILWVPV